MRPPKRLVVLANGELAMRRSMRGLQVADCSSVSRMASVGGKAMEGSISEAIGLSCQGDWEIWNAVCGIDD